MAVRHTVTPHATSSLSLRFSSAAAVEIRARFGSLAHASISRAYHGTRHQHGAFEIIIALAGRYECLINDARVQLKPWEAAILQPGDVHQDLLARGVRYYGLGATATIPTTAAPLRLFSDQVRPERQRCMLDEAQTAPLLDGLAAESCGEDSCSPAIQDTLCTGIFWQLIRAIPPADLSPALRAHSPEQEFMAELDRYFHRHLAASPSVESIARGMGMSAVSLRRRCRAVLGCSPARAFTRYRMQQARNLLAHTSLSVKEVGFALGFANPFHFSRVYKGHFGTSPSVGREQA
jgi:AraC-like DNA-binding protein